MDENTSTPPTSPAGDASAARSLARLLVQLLGFLVGLALLGWCVRIAFAPENREQLNRLLDASPTQVLLLLGLSVAVLAINGLNFWVVLRPVRSLHVPDVLATNAIATFLGYLPFKLGMLTRIVIHNKRDGIPVITISAWILALIGSLVLACGPMVAVTLLRPRIDAAWWALVLASIGAAVITTVLIARRYHGDTGAQRLHTWARRLRLAPVTRLMHTELFRSAHAGLAMLCSPLDLGAAAGIRIIDMNLQAARFLVAAAVLGVSMSFGEAMLIAIAYFIIGAASPVGMLGSREAGVVGLAAVLGIGDLAAGGSTLASDPEASSTSALAVLALFVTGTESVAFLACAGVGAGWLRIDRLLLKGRWHREADENGSNAIAGDGNALPD